MNRALPANSAQNLVHLIHCVEAADPFGKIWSETTRLRAAQGAGITAEASPQQLIARAQTLLQGAPPALRQALEAVLAPPRFWQKWLPVGLLAGALLLGWATNELGPNRLINILSFPLLGLILWNLVVCAAALWREFRPAGATQPIFSKNASQAAAGVADETTRNLLTAALERYFREKAALHGPRQSAGGKLVFHAAALLLAAGVVLGMYAQGIGQEYRAGWESTFLDAAGLEKLLRILLGPAAALSGIALPDAALLEKLRMRPETLGSFVGGAAAPFIHLWALTAALFIGLPRLILILLAWRQRRDLKAVQAWWKKAVEQVCEVGQRNRVAEVVPIGYGVENASGELLRILVMHAWPEHRSVRFLPTLMPGEEAAYFQAHAPEGADWVLVLNFAATPETELHGELLGDLRGRAHQCLIILDALSFAQRHEGSPEFSQRLAQRRAAWQRVVGQDTALLVLTKEVRQNPHAALQGWQRT